MTALSIPMQYKDQNGMSVLEMRRCCVRSSKGVYEYTATGEKLIKNIENAINDIDWRLSFKRKLIKREAKRPGPKQLVAFSIFQCNLKSTKKNWKIAIDFINAFSSLLIDFNIHNRFYSKQTISNKNLYIDHLFKSNEDLNHTIANMICVNNKIEINIGLEVLCTAIANRNNIWPAKIQPFHFEVFVSKRASKKRIDELLSILCNWNFSYELVCNIKNEKSFCHQRIIISDGKLPYLLAINGVKKRKDTSGINNFIKNLNDSSLF